MKTIEELGISPTPWKAVRWGGSDERMFCSVEDSSGGAVCDCLRNSNRIESDARLIAAAPELYEALAAMLSCAEKEAPFTTESGMSIAMDMARKAIKKAGGKG